MLNKKILAVISIIFLIAILFITTGCGEKENIEQNSSQKDTQNVSISKIDDTKDIVYSAFEKAYNYFSQQTKIEIPAVNLKVKTITDLNSAIMEDYQEEIEQNEDFVGNEITYEYYENGAIVSIVIKQTLLEASIEDYKVYNVNIETGEVLSKEDILAQKNITKEAYEAKVKTQLTEKFEENGASMAGSEFYETQKAKNSSDENCSLENTQVYIGENGNLNYIANLYSLAGADKYQKEFDYGE